MAERIDKQQLTVTQTGWFFKKSHEQLLHLTPARVNLVKVDRPGGVKIQPFMQIGSPYSATLPRDRGSQVNFANVTKTAFKF
ncbi:hypothetical protein SAMN05421753_112227 [Planctomicrobium piriforme]|uniref:Uncharacterized protein n=1 Tax=Planctomicrobium piriforme TaxID=1576369 RepID=A0A1I3LDI6_9PLAN|nr:hypothetical protein SAMN05421753_112227 [Planctomicrobium piriforme]